MNLSITIVVEECKMLGYLAIEALGDFIESYYLIILYIRRANKFTK